MGQGKKCWHLFLRVFQVLAIKDEPRPVMALDRLQILLDSQVLVWCSIAEDASPPRRVPLLVSVDPEVDGPWLILEPKQIEHSDIIVKRYSE